MEAFNSIRLGILKMPLLGYGLMGAIKGHPFELT